MSALKRLLNKSLLNRQALFPSLFKHSMASISNSKCVNTSCSFTLNSASYCDGYSDNIYYTMKNDKNRTSFYQNVIAKHCKNKVVVDIGCGSLALLSIMAAQSNASKVYAIEINKTAFDAAKQLIQQKGLSHKIQVIHGHSNDIKLPQKCDIIVHEIIGEIASCEGVIAVIDYAKNKFLKTTDTKICSIPDYVETYLIPVEFPDTQYWQSLDVKVIQNPNCKTINLWDFPSRHILCSSDNYGLWEHIQFNDADVKDDATKFTMDKYEFTVQKDGVLGGLLSAIEVGVDKEHILSSKIGLNNCHWANKFMMLDQKIQVKKGDKIYVSAKTEPNDHILKYHFDVTVATQ